MGLRSVAFSAVDLFNHRQLQMGSELAWVCLGECCTSVSRTGFTPRAHALRNGSASGRCANTRYLGGGEGVDINLEPNPFQTHARTHYTNTHARTHAHTHTHACKHTHTQTHIRTQTHTHTRTHARTHARTYARTHTHINKKEQTFSRFPEWKQSYHSLLLF